MTTKMTMFNGGALPAHLQGKSEQFNEAAKAGVEVTAGMRRLKHKGKKWAVRVGDEDKIFKDANGRNAIDLYLAIVAVRPAKSKRYFPGKWKEDSNNNAPMSCFSVDGVKPDETVNMPEHGDCARCPKNEFGSADNGKGKACGDYKRVIVSPLDGYTINGDGSIEGGGVTGELLRWDVPPSSLKNFGKYAQMLDDNAAPMNGVITCMRIDEDTDYPLIDFAAAGWLSVDDYATVEALFKDNDVQKILDGDQERYRYKFAHEANADEEDSEAAEATEAPKFDAEQKSEERQDGDASTFDAKMEELGVEGF